MLPEQSASISPASCPGRLIERKSGDVATRPRQALDPAVADRVAGARNDDWNRARELDEYWNDPATIGDNGVRIEFHEICRVGPDQLHIVGRPALVELDVHAFAPSQPLQLLLEGADAGAQLRIARPVGHQHSDPA